MAKNESRFYNSIRNSAFGLFAEVTTLVLGFIVRSVFIKTLSDDYLGVNGLFTNILSVLSFAELGVGNAIVFSLYKPIRDKDEARIAQYVQFYKHAYRVIGAVVASLGLCLVPFLGIIITNKPDIPENLTLIYLLYLANTVFSYFCVWKRTFMTANQERYIGTVTEQVFTFLQIILQIVFLYTTHNFVIYLLIMIVSNQVRNLVISFICSKRYPVVTKKPETPLSGEEKNRIFTNVKSLLIYKLSGVALDSTDNILLDHIISFTSVALYSNYTVITSAFRTLANQLLNGVTASVGNLNASDDDIGKEKILFRLLFVSFWLYALLSTGFAAVAGDLIGVWLAGRFVLDVPIVLAVTFSFFIEGMQFTGFTYRTTMGLFRESRLAPIAAAVLNIALSIILGKIFGMAGIFAATGISRLLTTTWVDAYLVFKRRLSKSPKKFFMHYALYFLFTAVSVLLNMFIVKNIPVPGWGGVLIKIIACFISYNLMFLIAFGRTKVFCEVAEMFIVRTKSALRGRRR